MFDWLAWEERWAYLNCPIGISCVGPARKKKVINPLLGKLVHLILEFKLRSLITTIFRCTASLYKNIHWKLVDSSFQCLQSPVGCFIFHPETSASKVASQKEAMAFKLRGENQGADGTSKS